MTVRRAAEQLPEHFGPAIRAAHEGCAAAVAAARDAWRADGDDSAYLATVREACYQARRALDDACYEPRTRSRGMDTIATYIAAPYSLERHVRAAENEVIEAERQRARAVVGPHICEAIDAVHAVTQIIIDQARDAYIAGGSAREYLAAIDAQQHEAQWQLDVLLSGIDAKHWRAKDTARLDAYGYRATEDQHQRWLAEREARRAAGERY